jgi:hypothetical protein
VFRDIVSISLGDRFDSVLEEQLAAAQIVLVLIGPAWLGELKRRLIEGSADYHRMEVATALKLRKRVIPVLLRGADLPPPEALPEDLRGLTKCQKLGIQDEAWRTDVDRLIDAIGHPYRWDLLMLRTLIAVVVITLGVWKIAPRVVSEQGVDYPFWRSLVLVLFAAYAFLELLIWCHHFRMLKRLRGTA